MKCLETTGAHMIYWEVHVSVMGVRLIIIRTCYQGFIKPPMAA